jgi:hypothetical protein
VICALLRDFSKHGEKAIAKVRRTQPAAYLKICALLAPKEMKLEHTKPLARTNSNAEPGKSLGRRSRPSRSTLMVGRPRRNRYDDQRQRKNHREAKSTSQFVTIGTTRAIGERAASPPPALHGVAHVCPIAAKDGRTALPYRMGRRCQLDVKFRAVEAAGAQRPI